MTFSCLFDVPECAFYHRVWRGLTCQRKDDNDIPNARPECPLYRLVAAKIEARIAAGTYPPGTALPPELALESEFNVSRITIRQALGLLKRRGLLYSRSGLGTLVRLPGPNPHAVRITGSLTDLIAYGAETAYSAVDRTLTLPPRAVADTLGLPRTTPVLLFRGVRSRPDAPQFAFEAVYIPEPLGRTFDNTNLGGRTLFSLLEEVNSLEIVEAQQVITAAPASKVVSEHLGVRPRSPVLRVTRSYKVADARTVEVAVSHYDPSKFQYTMTLYRE